MELLALLILLMLGRSKVRGTAILIFERPNAPITGIDISNSVTTFDPSGNTRDLVGNCRLLLHLERFLSKPRDMLDEGDEISFGASGILLSHISSIKVTNMKKNIWISFIRGPSKF